jgi:enoyl-CoA hydratase/carnithine racemase
MAGKLEVQDREGGVRVLTVVNPAKKNAIDPTLLEALAQALVDSAGVRAWLVRGQAGGIFSAGFDLSELGEGQRSALPDERLGEVLDLLTRHPAPSVALVEGLAIGAGCELALACDFRVGSQAAAFLMPPARLGVVYALKGLQRATARVGEAFARYMFLTGRRVLAEEAARTGLLTVLSEEAPAAAEALCGELAANAPLALAGIKHGLSLLHAPAISSAELAVFQQLRREAFASEDAKEGVSAVLAKRTPSFIGR